MIERVVDLSEDGGRLHVECGRLAIDQGKGSPIFIPVSEVAVLILGCPQISLSQPVLAQLSTSGGIVLVCDHRRMPASLLMPFQGNGLQAERMAAQARASKPLKKQIWKQIVQAKIGAQARLLEELYGDDAGLGLLARRVASGDSGNLESQAAGRYWKRLFGESGFRRRRDAEDQNRFLNYGYAVLRGVVARAICSAGLHPTLGVQHHNRYDGFCLVDDLIEPFRPVVDRAVVSMVKELGAAAPLDREAKSLLLQPLLGRFEVACEERTLFDLAARAAQSLVGAFTASRRRLDLAVP